MTFRRAALAALLIAVLALTACGSKADDSADNSDANTDNQTGETVTVKLGVVGGIYDDLWASAKAALADEGIDLEIVQFSDYVTPNNALANGDIDLNAFQHRIYLQNEIDNYGYAIQNIGNTFIIPLNLYSHKVSSVDEIQDGDTVAAGGLTFQVLSTPGHTPGSVCLLCENVLFSGDTLFAGSYGRTDFLGGSSRDMAASLKRLSMLPPETRVLPGHGPSSTIKEELRTNPYLRGHGIE